MPYYLEIRPLLKDLFSTLIIEGVFKQLFPHDLAIAFLYANGRETLGYERGYGRGREKDILKMGKQMLSLLSEESECRNILDAFFESGLRHDPQGAEGLRQKRDAKQALINLLVELFDEALQPSKGGTRVFLG